MAYLLDSNLLIYSASPSYAFLQRLILDSSNFASVISKVETLGFHQLDAADEVYFTSLFSLLTLLPLTTTVIDHAVRLRQQRRMTLGDSLIAATAIEFRLDVATRNTADFTAVPSLRVFNPFQP